MAETTTIRTNMVQVGGAAIALGQTTKSGSIPVTIASDQGTLAVDGSAATQPISAAALPLPAAASTSTKQSDGSQKTQIVDGSGNVIGSTANAIDVNIKSGAGSGGTAIADDTTFTAATTSFTPVGGVFNDAIADATSGKAGAARITAERAIHTNLRNNSGTEVGTAGTPLQVSLANTAANATAVKVDGSAVTQPVSLTSTTITGTVAATQSGTWTVQPGNTANTTAWKVDGSAVTQPVSYATTGSGTATGALRVELPTNGTGVVGLAAGSAVIGHVIADSGSTTAVTGNVTVTQATGTNLHAVLDANSGVDIGKLTANQSVNMAQIGGTNTVNGGVAGTQGIGGTVATNVAITANPVNLGAQAVSSENTAVTTARQVQLVSDLVGKLITLPYANPENFVNGTTAAITDTTSTSVIASAGGSLRNYVTSILVTNSHATVGTFVKILDGSTIIYEGYAAAAGGGFSASLPVPLRGTAATAINAQAVTTGANFIVSCAGYKGV